MNKYRGIYGVILGVMIAGALSACGSAEATQTFDTKSRRGVSEVLEEAMSEAESKETAIEESALYGENEEKPDEAVNPEKETFNGAEQKEADGIDVDLSEMSGTMVFAEVYNMMMDPMSYIGKTVKMNGSFAVYHDDEKNKDHYACIIRDATACCEQGVEFMLRDDCDFPDEYPKEGEEITVTGEFKTYKDGEYTYWALMDAERE